MKKITAIIHNSQEYAALKGDTGATGPQGDSFQPIEDVSGLVLAHTMGQDNTKAMSQKGVSDQIMDDRTWSETAISSQNSVASDRRYISSDVWKSESSTTQGAIFPVKAGKTYKLAAASGNIYYAFVTAKSSANNDPVSYAGEATGLSSLSNGASVSVVAPSDAVFLYTSRKSSSTVVLPTVKEIETTKEHMASLGSSIDGLNESVKVLPLLGLTETEDITSDITWAGDGYVSIDQIVVSSSSITHYSTPIHLAAGECIVVQTRVNTSLMVLTEDTGQNSVAKYNVLVKGMTAPETGNNTYAYIAPRDMNVVISTFKSSDCFVTIRRKPTEMSSKVHEALYLPPRTYNILAAYDNLVAIGDSLTKGVVYTLDGSRVASRPFPKVLQKTCGFDNLSIWAEGGKNAEYIWATFSDQFAIPQTGKTLCIVFLGTNGGFTDTLDTEAPEGDEENWDMTKRVPCYAKIVKTFADLGANILLIKPWTTGTQDVTLDDTFATIDGVAERYGCAVIKAGDIKSNNFKYHCYPTCNGVNLLHFNELGYAHFASAIINAVNESPDDNLKFLVPR